jgi:predicted nucleotidyltransferase component of viral defense system
LRIVHENNRFSEDLDFDNFNLSQSDFNEIADIIRKELQRQGYEIEMENVFSGAFHCYIKFPGLLFEEGLSGHEDKKILIQLATEPPHFDFTPNSYILNKIDVFTSIRTTPPDILLAQKFFALINRKRKKGRDFYDILFLLKAVRPNLEYLNLKAGISDVTALKDRVLKICSKTNLDAMAKDVSPFLFNPSDLKQVRLFGEYIQQIL